MQLVASSDRVDLWLCSWRDCDDRLIEQYRGLLSADELGRAERFVFEHHRRRHVVTHALVRTVLSRYASASPAEWRFTTNPYGRPEIGNHGDGERALSFNVSHSGDLILLGVTLRNAIGVDLEEIRADRASLEIAERFFAREEVVALKTHAPSLQAERFFDYWTLKESYIKARGMGLSIALDSFGFELPDNGIVLTLAASSEDDVRKWCFWQLRPVPRYVAACCLRCEQGGVPSISLRRTVPLEGDALVLVESSHFRQS